jgi:hypothetical protein|tara:strand:+ start:269 stop:463 length:195 start_codon:yes stop_codon:yes gene_type:complete
LDLIILHEGMYQLVAVTPELVAGEVWKDCFDLCDILREKLAVYNGEINKHVLKDGRFFFGCICN